MSELIPASDPIVMVMQWLDEETACKGSADPTAMSLATLGLDGYPRNRVVLFKGLLDVDSDQGFSFYTNYESDKGRELESIPKAALSWYWPETYRQVRLVGDVVRVSSEQSDTYFKTRPAASQASAMVSKQSSPIESRVTLDDELNRVLKTESLQRPDYWGGYVLIPKSIEFWQGRSKRLHDRLRYDKSSDNWNVTRLAP